MAPIKKSKTTGDGEKKVKQKGVGSGNYVRAKRGGAITAERRDLEMMRFVEQPDTLLLQEKVEREVIRLGGRPPKYVESDDPEIDTATRMFRLLIDVSNGMRTIDGCAALLGCSDDTLREWQRTHERFSASVKMGKKIQEMKAAQRMSQGITYPTSLIFTMKNLHNWADRIEQTHSFSMRDLMQQFQTASKPVDWDNPPALTLQATATLLESGIDTEVA